MDKLKIFENKEFGELEIIIKDGKEYFAATQCAKILGYVEPQSAIRQHCKADGCVKHTGVSITVNQHGKRTEQIVEKKYINEGNLYRLITHSKLPGAEKFEKWVFDEVLPSIRKIGLYATPEFREKAMADPNLFFDVVDAWKNDRKKLEKAEKQIALNEPKVKFADAVVKSDSNISIRQMAKLLCDQDISIGEKRLFALLRENNILMYNNEPYQTYMNRNYLVVTEKPYSNSYGSFLSRKTLITPKGQLWVANHIQKWMQAT